MKKKTKRKMKAVKYMTVALYKEHEKEIKKLMRIHKLERCDVVRYRILRKI